MLSLEKDKIKVLLLEGIHSSAVDVFNQHGYCNVELLSGALEKEALIEKLSTVHMVGIRSRTQLTEEVLEKAKNLIAVGCFCIGTNQVRLEKAMGLGIPVFNAPHSNTRSVAELVIGLSVMLLRQIFPKSLLTHRGGWDKSAKGSSEMRGKTIGIIGYGHIGSQVSVLAESMGMQVLFYDIVAKLPLGNARPVKNLEQLLKNSDIVTLHVPETPATTWMIGAKELKLMKKGARLINTSRGKVVDIEALAEALKSGKLAGAALDVFPVEPKESGEVFHSPLKGMENVILTPHIGGSTVEAQEKIGIEVAHKLVYFSDRGSTEGATNFPELNLQPHAGSHRLLHIHENIPGMLQQINTVIAKEKINILGQFLLTKEKIGYVVLDTSKDTSARLFKAVRAIKGTIKARILY